MTRVSCLFLLCICEVTILKLIHHLDPYVVKQLNKIRGPSSNQESVKRIANSLSKRELADLMDTNKTTYRKVRGAWRCR